MNISWRLVAVAALLLFFFMPLRTTASTLREASPCVLKETSAANETTVAAAALPDIWADRPEKTVVRHHPKRLKMFRMWKKIRKELRQYGFEFKWGWFLLAVFFGPLGFLFALTGGRDAILSALIGLGVFIVVAFICLLLYTGFSLHFFG